MECMCGFTQTYSHGNTHVVVVIIIIMVCEILQHLLSDMYRIDQVLKSKIHLLS